MHQSLISLKTEFRKSRNLIFAVFIFFMTATLSFFATSHTEQSSAASLNDFKPGNIISDAVMGNYNSMSVDDIQRFLTSKNPCNNTDYNQYLASSRTYPNVTWHWSGEPYNGHFVCISEERFGEGTTIGSGQTAAEIIYGAAQEYKINPQVLIVLLEKEQGLITDTLPHSGQYRAATGYGCPDTAACDSKYYGLKNQVYNAAWLFRYTLDNGYYAYPEKTKGVYVAYNPSSSCGRSEVYIENRATAALYRYTPYQPNAAALAAGSGYGDSCSAYGNRNFYLFFTSWFGSTQATINGEPITVPDGTYSLVSKLSSSRTLGVSGTNAQLAGLDSASQTHNWKLQRNAATGYYTITNASTNTVLSSASTSPSGGTNAQTSYSNGTCASQWKLYRTPSGYITFESACTPGIVLDVDGGYSSVGTNVKLWLTNNSNAQQWQLRVGQVIPDGTYTIGSEADSRQVVDITDWRRANGTRLQVWQGSGASVQKWQFKYNPANDTYTITNINTNWAIDLYNAEPKDNAAIQIWGSNGTCAQNWKVVPVSSNSYSLVSACDNHRVIGLSNNTASNGARLQLQSANNSTTQKWLITPTSIVGDNVYTITSALDRTKAIDISGGAETASTGTNIQLWDANRTKAQKWVFSYHADKDAYTITNPTTQKVLYLAGAGKNTTNQTNVNLGVADGTCAQFWKLTRSSDGSYLITTSCPVNRVLDVYDARTKNGTNIQIWDTNRTNAQKWFLVAE